MKINVQRYPIDEFYNAIVPENFLTDISFKEELTTSALDYQTIVKLIENLKTNKYSNILDLGLGISTLIFKQYQIFQNCKLTTIEHNQEWIDIFTQKHGNDFYIKKLNLKEMPINDNSTINTYDNFYNFVKNEKYDFICIDGPIGSKVISRINVLQSIPEILPAKFTILLHDTDRVAEKLTYNLMLNKLHEHGIFPSINIFNKSTFITTFNNLLK